MPKALVFGANGFVGPWLVREMEAHEWEICCSDRASDSKEGLGSSYWQADLLDADAVSRVVTEVKPNAIVNLAAISSVSQSWRAPKTTIEVNVLGSMNVLEAAKSQGTCPKVLFVGSSEEYAPSKEALAEESPLAGNNPYGISKRTMCELANLYEVAGDVRVCCTRSFNHTGPGQAPSFVIPSWCSQVANIERSSHEGTIRVGNLSVCRDFSDVRDIVRGYRMLLESNCSGETFNFGSGIATSLKDILEIVIGFTSQNVSYDVKPSFIRPTDQPCVLADISKAKRELGWEPEIPLSRTLHDVYKSFLGA